MNNFMLNPAAAQFASNAAAKNNQARFYFYLENCSIIGENFIFF